MSASEGSRVRPQLGALLDASRRWGSVCSLDGLCQQLLDAAQTILVVLDPTGEILLVNRAGEELLGRPAEELLGRSWFETCLPEEDRAAVVAAFRRIVAGEIEPFEQHQNPIQRADGTIRIVEWRNTLLQNRECVVWGSLSSGIDVTERIRSEEALRASEERYRSLVEHANDAILVADAASGRLVEANHRAEELVGIPRGHLLEMHHSDLHPPEEADRYREMFARHIRRGQAVATDVTLRHASGRFVPVSISASVVEVGGRALVQGIFRDLTEERQRELELRLAATVFQGTSEGVMITDADARIVDVNDAFTRITGYPRDEVVGANPRLLASGRHDEAFYQAMWRSLEATGRWQGEVWNRARSGALVPEWLSISAIRDEQGETRHYVGVFSDISTIKERESRLDHLAHHDPLTGLPNRMLLSARLSHTLARARREGSIAAVLFLDLDRFKEVNDRHGHPQGDLLLQEVGRRLAEVVRQQDTVARLGGDEFAVALEGLTSSRGATVVAREILERVGGSYELGGGATVRITTSIGIALFPRDGDDDATLLRHADLAMYRAKELGRGTYQFYSDATDGRDTLPGPGE